MRARHPNEKILPWYRRNRPAAKAAGIRVGGYHFLTTGIPSSTPKEEAEFFLSRLELKPGDLLPACDFEQEPPDATQALAFLRIVEQREPSRSSTSTRTSSAAAWRVRPRPRGRP